jgi:hypothetical protein
MWLMKFPDYDFKTDNEASTRPDAKSCNGTSMEAQE